ncbi:MarR family transcriptional regulator [Ekhidna sp.]|uniref:MarR family winged helix-turn-helix transcriptional regulator n=1 Tax=Ekhidna sp. TaxID=2608089 RepID=UPI0032973692
MIENVILFQIDLTSKLAKSYSQQEFDRIGLDITVEQWILLKIVEESEGLSQRELASKSNRDPASITRTLDLLEKKNMIQRELIPGNRRQYRIILAEEGKKFIKIHMPLIEKHRKNSIKGLTDKEIQLLHDMLKKIQNNMK